MGTLQGHTVCLLAYGETAAGKTALLVGGTSDGEAAATVRQHSVADDGLMSRLARELFAAGGLLYTTTRITATAVELIRSDPRSSCRAGTNGWAPTYARGTLRRRDGAHVRVKPRRCSARERWGL